jgi:hypothetical protein
MIRSVDPDRPGAHATRELSRGPGCRGVIAAAETRWREWNEAQLLAAGEVFQRQIDPLTGAEVVWPESVGRFFARSHRQRGETRR